MSASLVRGTLPADLALVERFLVFSGKLLEHLLAATRQPPAALQSCDVQHTAPHSAPAQHGTAQKLRATLQQSWSTAAALVGGFAASALLISNAACEAPSEDDAKRAEETVKQAWSAVQTQLDNVRGSGTAAAVAPEMYMHNGQLCIRVGVRSGVSIGRLESQLIDAIRFTSSGASAYGVSLRRQTVGNGTTVWISNGDVLAHAHNSMAAKLFMPSNRDMQGYVELHVPLQMLARGSDTSWLHHVFTAANDTRHNVPRNAPRGMPERWEGGFEDEMRRQMEAALGGFFGAFGRGMLDELERNGRGLLDDMGDMFGTRDAEPIAPYGGNGQWGAWQDRKGVDPDALAMQGAMRDGEFVGGNDAQRDSTSSIIRSIESAGATVYMPDDDKQQFDWGMLAGYEDQKQLIENNILLPLKHPDVFDAVARGTRQHFQGNRPRAVLFEGPPGTGKTTSARIIARQASVPLVYIPLDAIMSKYYGESEKKLAQILRLADSLGGAIIFIDEIDSLAISRDGEMWEATRRLLSVLLSFIDGFDSKQKTVVIGATNRKDDLDAAMLSRFDNILKFDLPNENTRFKILQQFAKHLRDSDLKRLAESASGMAGRDLRDICEGAERAWASKIVTGKAKAGSLPTVHEYMDELTRRKAALQASKQAHRRVAAGRALVMEPL